MSTITINGKTFFGNNVTINNGKVYIDGKNQTPDAKEINIEVIGNVDNLTVDAANLVNIVGNAHTVQTISGDVKCNDVSKSVKTTSGSIDANTIHGDADSMSGSINADIISGNVKTMSGSIKYKNK
jgi:hypothetical protein